MNFSENLKWKARALGEAMGLAKTVPKNHSTHLQAAIDWLCRAQDVTDDEGVAQTYLVRTGHWAKSYPETTGYIIPTFFSYAQLTGRRDIFERARRMADWECQVQLPEGGVLAGALGDSDQPTVFNTGQVLFGWVRAFEETGDIRYRDAAVRAANWLCEVQDEDGCWRRFGSPMTGKSVNTYNTRTAFGLIRVHAVTGEQRYLHSAVRNVEWALTQAHENGWLEQNCLQDDARPFVHTIAYAMRGMMEVGVYAERVEFVQAARKIGDGLLGNLRPNGFLAGRFDKDWRAAAGWSCLTGDAQIAINWARLYQLTGEEKYREATHRINAYLKTTQKLIGDVNERGAIRGSQPSNGGYHPWQCPNWAAKFFADALMLEETLSYNQAGVGFKNDG